MYLTKAYNSLRGADGGIETVLKKARVDFENIPLDKHKRPLIGIVGEIFVRSNRFSNENLAREIEELGGEAWMPPVSEWLFYINCMSKRHAWKEREYGNFIRTWIKDWFQKRDEHRMEEIFRGYLGNFHEPTIEETLRYASPYLHESFEGEAILSIGKSTDFLKKGASGIINVSPFTCIPIGFPFQLRMIFFTTLPFSIF